VSRQGAHSGEITVRDLLSSLTALQALSMVMTDSKDDEEILELAVSALRSLTQHCRAEAIWLDGHWQSVGSLQGPGDRAAGLEAQLVSLGSAGGALRVSDLGWVWAFPLSSRGGASGYIVVGSPRAPPEHAWSLIQALAQQTGVALANARLLSRERDTRAQIANEQAALRRVATLVARAAPPEEVFTAVAAEAGRSRDADLAVMCRYNEKGAAVVVGAWVAGDGDLPFHVGTRLEDAEESLHSLVFRAGQPARTGDFPADFGPIADTVRGRGLQSAVGVPIYIEARLWGMIALASRREEPVPSDTEAWLTAFTELVATAIANAQARVELRAFAEEQFALRRIATLVAKAAAPEDVFAAVAAEVGRVLSADATLLSQYKTDGEHMAVGAWSSTSIPLPFPVGVRTLPGGWSVTSQVFGTGQPARIDDYTATSGPTADVAGAWGIRSAVGAPIRVEGQLWGVMVVGSRGERLPADTEARLSGFTELVATAVANAAARAALKASRARVVAAADATRRRIERDLHDGTQQRLVSLSYELRSVQAAVPPELTEVQLALSHASDGLLSVIEELREISRGIHPAILSEAGLKPALQALRLNSAVPVKLALRAEERLPEQVEVAAYYVVSEALTNATKHAHASLVNVELDAHGSSLQLTIRDDGVGGADPSRGSGLVGLRDRVEALGGTLEIRSRSAGGTTLVARFPLEHESVAMPTDARGAES
jgi:signal transduction histidine kinase